MQRGRASWRGGCWRWTAILRLIDRVATDLGFAVESLGKSDLFRETYLRFRPMGEGRKPPFKTVPSDLHGL